MPGIPLHYPVLQQSLHHYKVSVSQLSISVVPLHTVEAISFLEEGTGVWSPHNTLDETLELSSRAWGHEKQNIDVIYTNVKLSMNILQVHM